MSEPKNALPVPEAFVLHQRRSPVTDPWHPIYARTEAEAVVLGLRVAEQHCNSRRFLHGGVLASLADNAMGLSVHQASQSRDRPISSGALTLGMSMDYVSTASIGTWIEFRSRVHQLGGSIGVVDCLVVDSQEKLVARANATFRYRRDDKAHASRAS